MPRLGRFPRLRSAEDVVHWANQVVAYLEQLFPLVTTGKGIVVHDHQSPGMGGKLDHGLALTGLGDDDHGQYATNSLGFVTVGLEARLTAERRLEGTANRVTLTDNGPNSTLVLSAPQDLHAGANFEVGTLRTGSLVTVGGNLRLATRRITANTTLNTKSDWYAGVDTNTAVTVTLPDLGTTPLGTTFVVGDEGGHANTTNTITVATAGTDTIQGDANTVIEVPYGSVRLLRANSEWVLW